MGNTLCFVDVRQTNYEIHLMKLLLFCFALGKRLSNFTSKIYSCSNIAIIAGHVARHQMKLGTRLAFCKHSFCIYKINFFLVYLAVNQLKDILTACLILKQSSGSNFVIQTEFSVLKTAQFIGSQFNGVS